MLLRASKLIGFPILSLHVGGKIAEVRELIVDPDNLQLIACRVDGPLVKDGNIMTFDSVREFSQMGMIVDSVDEFVDDDEIIRVRDVLGLNFSLVGLKVETKKGIKLGKIIDFTVEPTTWQVQQLIVQRPFVKAFLDPELTLPRTQILEVTDYKVIVKDEKEKPKAKAPVSAAKFNPSFVNPFRKPDFAAEPARAETLHEPDEK